MKKLIVTIICVLFASTSFAQMVGASSIAKQSAPKTTLGVKKHEFSIHGGIGLGYHNGDAYDEPYVSGIIKYKFKPFNKYNIRLLGEVGANFSAGIRPEAIHDEPMFLSSLSDSVMNVNVDVTELMGAEIYLYLGFEGMEDATNGKNIIARVSSRSRAQAGDKITVAVDTSRIHIFDKDTEKCICH